MVEARSASAVSDIFRTRLVSSLGPELAALRARLEEVNSVEATALSRSRSALPTHRRRFDPSDHKAQPYLPTLDQLAEAEALVRLNLGDTGAGIGKSLGKNFCSPLPGSIWSGDGCDRRTKVGLKFAIPGSGFSKPVLQPPWLSRRGICRHLERIRPRCRAVINSLPPTFPRVVLSSRPWSPKRLKLAA